MPAAREAAAGHRVLAEAYERTRDLAADRPRSGREFADALAVVLDSWRAAGRLPGRPRGRGAARQRSGSPPVRGLAAASVRAASVRAAVRAASVRAA
ncbi:hypothetical protein ACU686_30895 [Yinghuangia aomiensis]